MRQLTTDYYNYVEELLEPKDVHELRAAEALTLRVGQALIFAVVLTLVHALLLYIAINDVVWVGLPLLVHVIISVALMVWTYGQYRAGLDVPFMALLAVSTAFTGVFGAIGTILSIILYGIFRQKAHTFGEWFQLIFPPDLTTGPEDVYNKIVVGIDENPKDYEVMPFLDVMDLGSEEQKRRALSKMTMKFHPRLAPAFLRALRDPSNAIRVQAATSVAKIEAEFMDKLEKIEAAREQYPDNIHVQYALAKFYDDYAYTGLLDRERELLNREKAIDTYKSYLQHDPNSTEAWAAIGRLLFRSKKWQEAADWFNNALARGWKMRTMILWYMECLYRLGDFDGLRKIAREHGHTIMNNEDLPKEVRESVALWSR